MADLEEEILAYRAALVGARVTDVAVLHGMLHGRNLGYSEAHRRVTSRRDRLQRLAVGAAPETVVSALRDALRSRAMVEYAVVDHGRDMATPGTPGLAAWTPIFGNPAAGAKPLARDLAATVDIPLYRRHRR
jgi:hypothetical protein